VVSFLVYPNLLRLKGLVVVIVGTAKNEVHRRLEFLDTSKCSIMTAEQSEGIIL
jgi:hypothetical protein